MPVTSCVTSIVPRYFSGGISNRKVAYMYELALKLDPEFRDVLASFPEIGKDTLDCVHAPGRVTVLDFTPDDGSAAGKNTIGSFCKKGNTILRIYESEIDGKNR